jgi:hypothetical protein
VPRRAIAAVTGRWSDLAPWPAGTQRSARVCKSNRPGAFAVACLPVTNVARGRRMDKPDNWGTYTPLIDGLTRRPCKRRPAGPAIR